MSTTAPNLTPEQLEAFGQELDAIRARVVADLGERDADYINRVIRAQRGLEVAGRGLLFVGFLPPAWIGGTAALSLSKILDNMEIGHNVMHGQYDWMNDPRLNGKTFEWDTACPGDQWRHSHNYMHHTHTNIVGQGPRHRLRHPAHVRGPAVAPVLPRQPALRGAARELLPVRRSRCTTSRPSGSPPARPRLARSATCWQDIWRKVRGQTLKDYVLFPLLSGPSFPFVLAGNATANLTRNLWAFTIIFCGHFPRGRRSSPRRRPRTRPAASGTTASCSARPT